MYLRNKYRFFTYTGVSLTVVCLLFPLSLDDDLNPREFEGLMVMLLTSIIPTMVSCYFEAIHTTQERFMNQKQEGAIVVDMTTKEKKVV